jgi:hypothetical protein
MVLYIDELNLTTELVGDSPDVQLTISVPAASVLLTDMCSDDVLTSDKVLHAVGMSKWKVSKYAIQRLLQLMAMC